MCLELPHFVEALLTADGQTVSGGSAQDDDIHPDLFTQGLPVRHGPSVSQGGGSGRKVLCSRSGCQLPL